MNKRRRIALALGVLLPLLFTPLLLVASGSCSSSGPLDVVRGQASPYSGYNSRLSDYIIISLVSSALIGYSFEWFINVKSTLKSLLLFLALLFADAIVLFVIALILNWHCWTF